MYVAAEIPKKKQQLLDAAQELFIQHGIRRVTIEEICKKAAVSKMTCYKHFPDKWQLARTVLDAMVDAGIAQFREMLATEKPFSAKLEEMLLQTTVQIHMVGAPFLEDMMQPDSPLYNYFQGIQRKTRNLSVEFFEQAQQQGQISADIKMPVLLFMLDQVSGLLNHPDFVQIMPDIQSRASELAAFLFYGFARNPG